MDVKYFNAPITLYSGFLSNHERCLTNVLQYALYAHTQKLEHGTELEKIKAAASYYNVSLGNAAHTLKEGKETYKQHEGKAMTGISLKMYWDFKNGEKTKDELAELVGYLALKSIVGTKAFFKLDNKYWLSRMDGRGVSTPVESLSPEISKYASEYQTKKLKGAIREKYGLVTYSRYTRGFYVSFTLSLEQLVVEAEKRRKSTKDKAYKKKEREIIEGVLARLGKS